MKNKIKDLKTRKILKETEYGLKKIFGNNYIKIILYGSYSKNKQDEESDIDIMFLTDIEKEKLVSYRDKIADLMVDLSLKYDVLVSIHEVNVYDYNNYIKYVPFYKKVEKEGMEIK
jgi:predicted nucleotidyltransferase